MWEPKLPKDYKEIILMSKNSNVYSMSKKEDIYNMLLKGILIQEGNVVVALFSHLIHFMYFVFHVFDA